MKRLLAYLIPASILGIGLGYYLTSSPDQKLPPTSGSDPQRASQLMAQRQELERTIWAKEERAQFYETYVIKLWDEIRNSQDRLAILEGLIFRQMVYPAEGTKKSLDSGVIFKAFDGKTQSMTSSQLRDYLGGLRRQGFVFVQGEAHHKNFSGDSPANARSEFSFVGHLLQPRTQLRWMVEGRVKIQWDDTKTAGGYYRPKDLEISSMVLKERWGKPPYVEILSRIPEGPFGLGNDLSPLLVYDLDRDGRSEIVLPRVNEVYWNKPKGLARGRLFDSFDKEYSQKFSAGILADFTGNGHADALLCRWKDSPVLYKSDSQGRFPDPPVEINIPGAQWDNVLAVTGGDVDLDGDLDVWLSQYRIPYATGEFPTPYYDANDSHPSYLLINQGGGIFQDETEARGLGPKRNRRTYSNSFVDLDSDGDLDLLTVNDFAGMDMHLNNGQGQFTDVTDTRLDQRQGFGMAHVVDDINGDGHLDIYMIGMSSSTARRLDAMGLMRQDHKDVARARAPMGYGNRLLLGDGKGNFRQSPKNEQTAFTGWSWGVASMDYDNDGDQDLYVVNGHLSGSSARDYCSTFWRHDIYPAEEQDKRALALLQHQILAPLKLGDISWNPFEHNFLLTQGSDGDFHNLSFLMNIGFEFDSRNLVGEDLDRDGYMDIILTQHFRSQAGRIRALKNRGLGKGNWIGVDLREEKGRSPLGARIRIHTSQGVRQATVISGDSYRSQHSLTKHFGLGDLAAVSKIEVIWPGGHSRTLSSPALGKYHYIRP